MDDATFELAEELLATMKFAQSAPQKVMIAPSEVTITILDDDSA